MIRILICDDHAAVRSGLRLLLERPKINIVAEAISLDSAIAMYKKHKPDIVLLDLSMPGTSGIEAVNHFIQQEPDVKLIIYTIHDNPSLVQQVIDEKALGYVTKGCPIIELIHAIEHVSNGSHYISSKLAQKMFLKNVNAQSSYLKELNKNELLVLKMVAKGYDNITIGEKLYISERTVANYISLVKQKLHAPNTVSLVHIAIENSLIEI